MTTERDKCGLSSLIPMSCRGRAEAFARRLHTRLRSLGSEDGNGSADESSWLAAHETSIAIAQPRHSQSDSEMYLDFGLLESPGSPQDEIEESELHRLINKDNLKHSHSGDCHCPKAKERKNHLLNNVIEKSNDSDSSDGPFYDTENELMGHILTKHVNGYANAETSRSFDGETDSKESQEISNHTEDSYATTSEGTHIPSSLSNEGSTLSMKDDDYPSWEMNGLPELGVEELQRDVSPQECLNDLQEHNYAQTSNGGLENGLDQCDHSTDLEIKCNGQVNGDENEIDSPEVLEIKFNRQVNGEDNEIDSPVHSNFESKYSFLNHVEDYTKHNGVPEAHCNSSDLETYVSSLNVDKDLTVECPSNGIDLPLSLVIHGKIDQSVDNNNDDSELEERTPRVRRCSSLKTGKTPPGTPGRKKIVRFADVLGLDLADVRTFLDEIPKIPTSAYEDLRDIDLSDSASENALKYHGVKSDKLLVPLFQQPGGLINFLDQVRDNLVCLENALVDDPLTFSIKGMVRVRNLDFHKSVHIRYSLDSWKTFADVQGVYAENSCDGFSDKFTFIIYAHTLSVGQRLEFAVRFQCKGCQYWDNNKGVNYCFQCLPATNNTTYTPITCVDDWGASFYY